MYDKWNLTLNEESTSNSDNSSFYVCEEKILESEEETNPC